MAPTIWQYGGLRVNDETAFPIEYVRPCLSAGYKRIELLTNARASHLPAMPDASYVVKCRDAGARVWGVVWADSFASPHDLLAYVCKMRDLYKFSGFIINAEDGWEVKDLAGLNWSKQFVQGYRSTLVTSKLALGLDTYNGCGGIALPWWQQHGARLFCQTFHESEEQHCWPIDSYLPWAKSYGWTKPSMIKPDFCSYKTMAGKLPTDQMQTDMLDAAKRAATKGMSIYYAEGGGDPFDYVIPFFHKAKAAGVCL